MTKIHLVYFWKPEELPSNVCKTICRTITNEGKVKTSKLSEAW